MVEVQYISPLKVPRDHTLVPQRQRRHDHGFPPQMSLDEALAFLEEELQTLGASKIAVYCNYERVNSPRNRSKRDDDSAICCEVHIDNRHYYLLCDHWYGFEHNMYALHLAIRAMRNIVKWGVADLPTLLTGFDAAQVNQSKTQSRATSSSGQAIHSEWQQKLGLSAQATLEEANASYRTRAKQVATDADALLELNQAIEQARAYFGGN